MLRCRRNKARLVSGEHETQETPGARSFEERVFARFDALDHRLDGMDGRLQALEARQYDTKPMWERALAEIAETRAEMRGGFEKLRGEFEEFRGESKANFRKVERQLGILAGDMIGVRDAMNELEARLDRPDKSPV